MLSILQIVALICVCSPVLCANFVDIATTLLGKNTLTIKTTTGAGIDMYHRWTTQAMSALMAAAAHKRIRTVANDVVRDHELCSKNANTIKKHARCVTKLLSAPQIIEGSNRKLRRFKRNVITRTSYKMTSSHEESYFGRIVSHITKAVRSLKHRKESDSWKTVFNRMQRMQKRMEKQHQLENILTRISRLSAGGIRSPTSRQLPNSTFIDLIRQGVNLGLKMTNTNDTGVRTATNLRLISPKFFSISPEHRNNRVTSITVMMREFLWADILSPSLFPLHEGRDQMEKITSLQNIMGSTRRRDREAVLDMITEVSGISEAVTDAEKEVEAESEGIITNSEGRSVNLSRKNLITLYGEEGYKNLKVMENVHSSYSKDQMRQFNKTGYALMTKEQRQLLYGKGAPFENEKILTRFQNMTHSDVQQELHKTIHYFATGEAKFSRRMKDVVLSPIIAMSVVANSALASQTLVLSPVILAPLILSPGIFGPIILSPWLFVPLIISPRALSPVIMSPALFSPMILSPLLMGPAVLYPGVANPMILSPFLMCPMVLSPQVMTPIILSPFALSPQVLSPFALSPVILSPFVLSPLVLSPPTGAGLILSPYAFSPAIKSDPNGITIFASPSFLS